MPYVYMLRCQDGSFYTGWTVDLKRRLLVHNQGKGARYTRARLPVMLVYAEELPDKSTALKREYQIKKLSHQDKEGLVELYVLKNELEEAIKLVQEKPS